MKYDFDTVIDRRSTNSVKWDCGKEELAMWIADMDFTTAPEIIEAIQKRAAHGIFGYGQVRDRWYEAYINWWQRRYGYCMEKDWLIFCTGVVPAMSSTVRKLTSPNENVVILTPVYNIFFNSIVNNGCRVLESPLLYENHSYSIDWEDLEGKLADPQTSLLIFCNPHNPVGKIWTREELARVGELCKTYGVTVFSDEIHCDITKTGESYIPFASVSDTCREISITAIAPTKAFNLAGLQTAAVSVPNAFLRHKIWRALNTDEVAEPNSFAEDAAIAAFEEGEEWNRQLRVYLDANRALAEETIKGMPGLWPVEGKATYLLWIDVSAISQDSKKTAREIRDLTGLYLEEGCVYGKGGETFLRMNIACPRSMLEDGLKRLKTWYQTQR